MPEYLLPAGMSKGSREHALYLTYVISIDYMTDARKLWANVRRAFNLYPERFQPSTILDLADRTLTSFLRNLGARYPKSALATRKKISALLNEKYEGDPRNITNTPLTIDEIRNRIDEFPYLRGDKLFNFYLRAMGENGLLYRVRRRIISRDVCLKSVLEPKSFAICHLFIRFRTSSHARTRPKYFAQEGDSVFRKIKELQVA